MLHIRICSEFKDPLVLISMYYSHIRSNLEYGSVVWYPVQVTQIQKLESVQKKFLIYMFKKFGWYHYIKFAPYNKTFWTWVIRRRTNACHYFIFDLLSGRVDALNILTLISIGVPPVHLRNYRMLVPNFHRTNYGMFEPINNIMLLFNTVLDYFDFVITRDSFRLSIRSRNLR